MPTVPRSTGPTVESAPLPGVRLGVGNPDFGQSVGAAVQRAGLEMLGKVHQANIEEQKRSERLTALARVSEFEVAAQTTVDDVVGRLKSGALTADEAPRELASAIETQRRASIDGIDPHIAQEVQIATIGPVRRAVISADAKFREHFREQARGAVLAGEGNLERIGLADPVTAITQHDELLKNAGQSFTPEEAEARRQKFSENTWFRYYGRATLAAETSMPALEQVRQAITTNGGLDTQQQTLLLDRVQTAQTKLLQRAEAQNQKRTVAVGKAIESTENVILRGYPAAPDVLRDLTTAARGTEHQADAERLAMLSGYISRFATATPATMEAELTKMDAQLNAPGATVNASVLEVRDKLRTLYQNTRTELAENPMAYATKRGLIPPGPIDFKNVGAVRSRVNAALTLQKEHGSPLRILLPEESASVARGLSKSTPDQKRTFFKDLERAVDDPAVYLSVLGQIAPDSPTTALAGVIASRGDVKIKGGFFSADRTFTSRKVSDLMLAGEALLNPGKEDKAADGRGKPMTMPPENLLNAEFSATYDAPFAGAPQARSAAYQGARAIYAALSAEAGDYSGQLDGARWKTAAHLATGGVVRYNGASLIPPYGLDEAAFTDRVSTAIRTASQAGTLPGNLDQLLRAPLEPAGDGVYRLRRGTGYVLDAKGQPVKIDLHRYRRGRGASGTTTRTPTGASGSF